MISPLTRRQLLLAATTGAGALALTACGSSATGAASTAALTTSAITTSAAATAAPAAPATSAVATSTVQKATSGSTASSSAAAVKPGMKELRITWFSAGSTTGIDYFGVNAKAFSTKNPGITVSIEPVSGSYDDKILTNVAGGTPPDVFLQGGRDFGLFVSKGVLLDLSSLIARDHYDTGDFFAVCMQLTTWKGKVYGLPDDLNLLGLYYNKDLFDKAGVQYPPTTWGVANWTWQDFEDTARKLTVANGGQTTQYGADFGGFGATGIAPVIWSYGGDFLDQNWTKSMLDQPQAESAISYLQTLVVKDKVLPTPADLAKQGSNPRFFAGAVGMRVAGAFFSNPATQSIKSFAWDVAALPSGPAGAFSATGGSQGASWSVAAGGKQQDDAWQLTQWMASPASLTTLTEHGWIGARKSIGTSSVYLDPKQLPAHRKVFVDGTDHIKIIPLIADWSDLNTAMDKGLTGVWTGSTTPQDAGNAIAQQVNGLLKQLPAGER
ncbi:MAG: ABC transporter substrate-binding protein [Chloroflexota bacterium]